MCSFTKKERERERERAPTASAAAAAAAAVQPPAPAERAMSVQKSGRAGGRAPPAGLGPRAPGVQELQNFYMDITGSLTKTNTHLNKKKCK